MLKKIRVTTGAEHGFRRQWADRAVTIAKCDECNAEFPIILESGEHLEDIPCFDCGPQDDEETIRREGEELRRIIEEGQRTGQLKRPVWS